MYFKQLLYEIFRNYIVNFSVIIKLFKELLYFEIKFGIIVTIFVI